MRLTPVSILKRLSVLTHILAFTASLMLPAAGILYYFVLELTLIESQSGSLAQANNLVRDVDELEVFIQQSMTTSDLIYTSGEVYLVEGALRQNALVGQRLGGLKIANAEVLRARSAISRVRADLESLPSLDEAALSRHINAYLATYDAELEILIGAMASLRAQSDVQQAKAREEFDRSRSRLDREQWLSGLIYIVYLFIILRVHLNQFVRPIRNLSQNARAAILNQGALKVSYEGPSEYQTLSSALEAFDRRLDFRMQIQRLVSSLSLQLMKNVDSEQILQVVVETTRSLLNCDDAVWVRVDSGSASMMVLDVKDQFLKDETGGLLHKARSLPFFEDLRCCFSRGDQPLSPSGLSKADENGPSQNVFISDVLVCVLANEAPVGFLQITALRVPALTIENLTALQQISDIIALVYEKALIDRELEARVLSRTRALSEQTQIAQAAQRAQSSFLTTLSHEIRTPFNSLSGMAQMLAETALDAEQEAAVDSILKGSDRLLKVISTMFEYAMLDSGKAEIIWNRLSVDNFAQEIGSSFAPQAASAGCDFRVEVLAPKGVEVETDLTAVRKIAQVLLDNALRYGADRPVVCTIELSPLAIDRSLLQIEVTDQGPGIPNQSSEALFEPFVQGGEVAQGGLGLGLATAQRYARLLGGLITYQAQPQGGSRFELALDCVVLPPLLEQFELLEQLSIARAAHQWAFYVDQEILNTSNVQSLFDRFELPLLGYDSIAALRALLEENLEDTAFILAADELPKQLLSISLFKRDGGGQGPRWIQLRLENAAVSDAQDANLWRAWRLPLSMRQIAQDLMSTTGITNSNGMIP